MMSNPRVEALGKERRLFWDKTTGKVMGKASGGGALLELRGDDLIVATFNDENAPLTIGMLECYFNPVGNPHEDTIDATHVVVYETAVRVLREARESGVKGRINGAFATLCAVRDLCVKYAAPPLVGE